MRTARYDGRGWFVLETVAGQLPEALREGAVEREAPPGGDGEPAGGTVLAPLTAAAAQALREQRSARLDAAAERCVVALELGEDPPPARLVAVHGVDGARLRLEVLWDPDTGHGFAELPGAEGERTVPIDPWLYEPLEAFLALHGVEVTPVSYTHLTLPTKRIV